MLSYVYYVLILMVYISTIFIYYTHLLCSFHKYMKYIKYYASILISLATENTPLITANIPGCIQKNLPENKIK